MQAIVDIAGDWEVARRLARMPHPYTISNAQFFIDVVVPSELVWSIVWRSSERVVGIIGLTPKEGSPPTAELGYYVAQTEWGKGIATEAGAQVVAFGTDLFGRQQLTSGYFVDNPASGRVLDKLGFKPVGTADRPCLTEGNFKPSIEMRLI
ncbi:GNAT family N-acetyltransferase [Glacieibacterium megasporae]|uniref:GNAT family N-acetyltransferase n=1 Tax=Glacieibacterium megasporae TaxID=2835787 RepID=UPI002104DA26|nr:GNAT family N-acetyltransferase [Polymorphobacter megasporae]